MNGKLYVIKNKNQGTEREIEEVVCADAETGEILWENEFNVFLLRCSEHSCRLVVCCR